MKKWFLLLFLLAACSSVQETEITVPAVASVIFEVPNIATQSVGEGCLADSDCLKPSKCIQRICALTDLEENGLCFANEQCNTRFCSNSGLCEEVAGQSVSFKCEYTCRHSIDGWGCKNLCHE